jgi:hypothetical protein
MAETIYRFNFVTDPDNPDTMKEYSMLMGIVDNNKDFILVDENLDRGLVKYDLTFDISSITSLNNGIDDDKTTVNLEYLEELIGKISYIPLTVTLDKNKIRDIDMNILGSVISGIQDIVKHLTEKLLTVNISDVEMFKYESIISFSPITEYNSAVYVSPCCTADYHSIVNPDTVIGYQVLSSDPLTRYVLEELYKEGEYVPDDINPIYIKGVAIIPITDISDEIVRRVGGIIEKKRMDGYFTYNISFHSMEDLELIRNLANLWDIEVVNDDDITTIVLYTDVDFGIQPEIWFGETIDLIKFGYFPSYTLYGPWQFYQEEWYRGDYNNIFGKEFYDVILYYGSLLSYKKLGMDDPFIKPFTHITKVNNDLSITVSLPTYDHVKKFKEYFDEILNGYDGVDMENAGTAGTWVTHSCKDLEDGIVKRWYVQSIDERAMPMVLYHENEDGTKGEVLVFRSPVAGLYRKDHPYEFGKLDMEKMRSEFLDYLREYYSKCNMGNNMNIKDYLEMVEVDNICINKNTITNNSNNNNKRLIDKVSMLNWGYVVGI